MAPELLMTYWAPRKEAGMYIGMTKRSGVAAMIGLATAIGALLATPKAEAAYIVTLEQVGNNVVATGSGTIDLAGLTKLNNVGGNVGFIFAQAATIATGTTSSQTLTFYSGLTGPANFGSGGDINASSGSGDPVAIGGAFQELAVAADYVSGSTLSDTETYDNQTFNSLGVTPGVYDYTFGSGATADSVTVDIGVPIAVPEPASLMLLGVGAAMTLLAARGRRKV